MAKKTTKKETGANLTFTLTRPAKSKGGDRYETMVEGDDRPLIIYLPQAMSRAATGEPAKFADLNINCHD